MKFKFHRLTLLASLLLTTIMLVVAFIFDVSKERLQETQITYYAPLMFSFLLMIGINYLVLEFMFNFYGKRQIKSISTILPLEMLKNQDDMDLRMLGEKVSEFSQKNASDMDTMKAMEDYRKEYIGNVSHEMKTPLFSIQGYMETLMDGGIDNLKIRDKYLYRINKLTERLLNIVVDLDMINKYESGEIELQISTFDIHVLIREIFDLLDLEATKSQSKFRLESTLSTAMVVADKQKIFQVLINLIANAVYYCNRENALITVHTQVIGSHLEVKVEDNGMGIKAEVLPRIFERFFRVESSRNRREGGSGLGLAIVKHIMEAHQESISVESTYLEGTVFKFLLPISSEL